jgi:hypothetical protein
VGITTTISAKNILIETRTFISYLWYSQCILHFIFFMACIHSQLNSTSEAIVIFLHFQSCLLIHLKYAHAYEKILSLPSSLWMYPFSWCADDICFESVMNIFICGGNDARHVFCLNAKTYSLKAINYLKIHGKIWNICEYCVYVFFLRGLRHAAIQQQSTKE